MRVAGLIQDSIVDGPGLRFVVFAQGCELHCAECHNPEARVLDGGAETDVGAVVAEMARNPLTDGLTLSGGEPFLQAADCALIAAAARDMGLSVWTYSGYTFEELIGLAESDPGARELLALTDVLVDGRFVLAERTLSAKWRGSGNQRLIDAPRSLAAGAAVEFTETEQEVRYGDYQGQRPVWRPRGA